MLRTSIRTLAVLAIGVVAVACQESPPTAPGESDPGLQAAFAQMAAEAARDGDAGHAERLDLGAQALRWGIRPSEIEVKIKNETFTYQAIMVGVVRRTADGELLLVRSLLAWTGRRPTATLQVSSASDQALFGHPANGNGPGSARGIWKDLVNHERWVATAGSADLELVSTGEPCPVQPADATLRCRLASYDIRINGNFKLLGPDGPGGQPIEIHTIADGVNGVVIGPAT